MVKIIDIKKLGGIVGGLLDNKIYQVGVEAMDRMRLTVFTSSENNPNDAFPVAQIKYGPNYKDIIIEELPSFAPARLSGLDYFKFLEKHRPKLQEMAGKLELKAQKEGHTSTRVIYINYND